MNNKYKGVFHVFNFTFKQGTKTKGYKSTTIIIGFVFFILLLAINVLLAVVNTPEEEEDYDNDDEEYVYEYELPSEISIYSGLYYTIDNETKTLTADADSVYALLQSDESYSEYFENDVTFTYFETDTTNLTTEEIDEAFTKYAKLAEDGESIIFVYTDEDNNISSVFISSDYCDTADLFLEAYNMTLYNNLGYDVLNLDENSISTLFVPVTVYATDVSKYGEYSLAEELVKMIVPMILILVIYMMVVLNGQAIAKSIVSEKVTKLMETLLVYVDPVAMVTGKVFGTVAISVVQVIIWIICGCLGYNVGNLINENLFPDYENVISAFFDIIREGGSEAFTIPAVIIAILAFAFGYFAYAFLAATVGALASKPEDMSNSMMLFNMPIIVGFMLAYFGNLSGDETIKLISLFLPISSAFSLSSGVLTGIISIPQSLISLAILIITSLVLGVIAGNIYKKKIF